MQPSRTPESTPPDKRVGLAGLGAVGRTLALGIDEHLPGYSVAAVSAGRSERAETFLDEAGIDALVVPFDELVTHADIVVEALPPALFRPLAESVLEKGRTLIVLSAGALLDNWDLVELAKSSGGTIMVPSGAILGLDGLLAANEARIDSVTMITRKPVTGLLGAPFLEERGIDLSTAEAPVEIFSGTAAEAISGFPANLNVAVAVSLAGIGPDRTRLEVWADPSLERNTHEVIVEADSARLRFSIENVPTDANPKTGRITALSVLALLRKLRSPLRIGT